MGNKSSKSSKTFKDRYTTYDQLEAGLRNSGLESSQLIIGIDFTKSNTWNGGHPYYVDANLHSMHPYPNPYQHVLDIICHSLEKFDDDGYIDAYGFGDKSTTNKSVFPFWVDPTSHTEMPCLKLSGVLDRYNYVITELANGAMTMSGPTNFAPLINKAIALVAERKTYHILLIICDGQVDNEDETIKAIITASNYPISIICVGVGKGPFTMMEKFDDKIKNRRFDNFQFVNFHRVLTNCENNEVEFAKHCMMEIPDQYDYIKKNILNRS